MLSVVGLSTLPPLNGGVCWVTQTRNMEQLSVYVYMCVCVYERASVCVRVCVCVCERVHVCLCV